jgi:hypothetical protein
LKIVAIAGNFCAYLSGFAAIPVGSWFQRVPIP